MKSQNGFFQIYALSFVSTTQKHDSQLPNKPYLSLARGRGGTVMKGSGSKGGNIGPFLIRIGSCGGVIRV